MDKITFTHVVAPKVKAIIDNLSTKHAIATWEAADKIYAMYGRDENLAVMQTLLAVGHGMDRLEADLIVYHIHELAKEV
jgi:hypothetical protein